MDKKPTKKAMKAAKEMRGKKDRNNTDTLGSYTGQDADGSAPVQDADDL